MRGRQLLRNVVEVDMASMMASLPNHRAAFVLFDFEAAFSSVFQKVLLEALEQIGLPEHILNVVMAIYHTQRRDFRRF